MKSGRRPSWGFLMATVGYMAWIYFLASLPGTATGPDTPFWRFAGNAFHIPLYAGLGACLALTLAQWQWPARATWTVAIGLAYAVVDEWHQAWVPGRSASAADMGLDGMGLALAVAGLWWLSRRHAALAEAGAR